MHSPSASRAWLTPLAGVLSIAGIACVASVNPASSLHRYQGVLAFLSACLLLAGALAYRHSVRLVKAVRLARRQHALFRAAAETAQNVFCVGKPVRRGRRIVDFRVVYANRGAAGLFQRTPRALRGARFSALLPESARADVLASWARVFATGATEEVAMRIPAADGPAQSYETRVVRFEGGIAISAVRACQELLSSSPEKLNELPGVVEVLNGLPPGMQEAVPHELIRESVKRVAQQDQLTGLPNRALLTARLTQEVERARKAGTRIAVYMVDIDNFTRINDSLGHDGGDALLVAFARQMVSTVLAQDAVVRAGGDEFVVITPDVRDDAAAARCAELILARASTPVTVGDQEVRVTASVGYCIFPECATEVDDLLRQADLAMHEAKRTGPGGYQAFVPAMEKAAGESLKMEEELRHAIAGDELKVYYQPQVRCSTGEVTGMEALLRWTSPTRGQVPPVAFLPVAEDAGLMIGIGEWVLRHACHDCVKLQRSTGRPLTVAVNLSSRQFHQRNLPSLVQEALQDSGLQASHLELEITEQMLMSCTPCVLDTLAKIRELGVKLALDDFGTGFSSFAYIMQYHVDRLKIDRSFVSEANADPAAAAIVRAIIAMAHGLDMNVVAEGVEDEELLKFLLRKKCDEAQGFLFAKAVPIDEFPEVVEGISNWAEMAKTSRGLLKPIPDLSVTSLPMLM